ncbi:MAG: hypothetical protein M1820_004954 [Bogoriella megaspora]|nr:MAG: hypothetical protein M1820_004954 [Bogoriella megaspora]
MAIDLYKRHTRLVHTEVEDNEPSNRTPIACTNCAKAKTKCDREIPCSRCKDKKIQCQPRSSRRSAEAGREAKRRLEQDHAPQEPQRRARQADTMEEVQWDIPLSTNSLTSTGQRTPPSSYSGSGSPKARSNDVSTQSFSHEIPPAPLNTPIFEMNPFTYGPNTDLINTAFPDQMFAANSLYNEPLHFDTATFSALMSPLNDPTLPTSAFLDLAEEVENSFDKMNEVQNNSASTTPASKQREISAYSTRATSQDVSVYHYECWPAFICNPPQVDSCSFKTAQNYLDELKVTLKQNGVWRNELLHGPVSASGFSSNDAVSPKALNSSTRDMLLVITQSLMQNATTNRRPKSSSNGSREQRKLAVESDCFIPMPPSDILGKYLQVYMARFEPYYCFVTTDFLSSNSTGELRSGPSDLLLPLMIAYGALVGKQEDWCLSSTLTEACRISQNLSGPEPYGSDETEAALRQWAVHTHWLKESILLNGLPERQLSERTPKKELGQVQTSDSRIVHAWIVMDLELSIFYDQPPKISVKDLAMPNQDSKQAHPTLPTFSRLFRKFLEREMLEDEKVTMEELQLLLHGVQCLASHLYECLMSFVSVSPRFYADHFTTSFGTRALLQELRSLLHQWYTLFQRSTEHQDDPIFLSQRTLILYHLMSARLLIPFDQLELLARSTPTEDAFKPHSQMQGPLMEEGPNVNIHCGQVMRLIRTLPQDKKPAWWAAAIYRATILLWATGWVSTGPPTSRFAGTGLHTYNPLDMFPIDHIEVDDQRTTSYLRSREGTPVLTTQGGQSVLLNEPDNILAYMLDFIDEQNDSTRFAEGIKHKVMRLRERWASCH